MKPKWLEQKNNKPLTEKDKLIAAREFLRDIRGILRQNRTRDALTLIDKAINQISGN
jgi:hypothetical protein